MDRKFTYRELTLLVGILVALIIAATFVASQEITSEVINSGNTQSIILTSLQPGKMILSSVLEFIF